MMLRVCLQCVIVLFPGHTHLLSNASTVVSFKHFVYLNILLLCISTTYEPRHETSNNAVCATSKGSDQPTHTHSMVRAFARRLNI